MLGEVAAGGVLKHSRDFNLTRECVLGTRLAPAHPGLRRPAGLRHRAGGHDPGGQQDRARARSTPGSPAAFDTTSDAPIAVNEDLRAGAARGQPGQGQRGPAEGADQAASRSRSSRRSRATPSRAPACRWASTPRSWPRSGASSREEQDELTVGSHRNLAAAYDTGLLDDLVTPFLGLERDQNLRPDTSVEKLAKLKPVFGGADGTMTAGNSTPLSRRRLRGAAGQRGLGGGARPAGAGVLRRRPDRRRRPRARARGTADGADLRRAEAARAQQPDACRTSTSTRSTRRSPPRCCAR